MEFIEEETTDFEPSFKKKGSKGKSKHPKDTLPEFETDIDADEISGDIESMVNDFSTRAKKEDQRRQDIGSLDYYFCVYFNEPRHKWKVLKALGLAEQTDGDQYINGAEFVEALNKWLQQTDELPVSKNIIEKPKPFRQSKHLGLFDDTDYIE